MLLAFSASLGAEADKNASVTGEVVEQVSKQPIEFVPIVLKRPETDTVVTSTATDSRGRFILEKVAPGDYRVVYGYVGSAALASRSLTVTPRARTLDLGRLELSEATLHLDKLVVSTRQREFNNTIDRKVYSVGKEIQSATGSASDLLQNIPSVQVDIDGNVSLRGSDNVMILINGRTSTLMGKSRAEVLQQLPADVIDKIEVITNPSAKYKPDGTAGIINIALKKKQDGGLTGTVTGNLGNNGRYNTGLSANYASGRLSYYGSYSIRQDDRPRRASDLRTITDPVTGEATTLDKKSRELSRPFTQLARAGWDYALDERNKVTASANYNHRSFYRTATDHNVVRDGRGLITREYDRTRSDPEFERSAEFTAGYEHAFAETEHELKLEFKTSATKEQEDNHYADIFQTPTQATTYDNTLIRPHERGTEALLEYARPLAENSKMEAGYTRSEEHLDTDYAISALDPLTGLYVQDPTKSNRFAHAQTVHAFYGTYARTVGRFGFLAGLRPEQAKTKSLLVNTGEAITNDYFRVYPSLHLSYSLGDQQELQLNYSHRVHRPESDDLNPFPQYSDPFTLRAGNPHLQPEDIHSFEAGYQFKNDHATFLTTVYHRYRYNGFTTITRDLGNSVLLTTYENLATNRSTGVELVATTEFGKRLSVNFSSNTYFNTIDASNLGFVGTKSDVSWSAKLGTSLHLAKSTLVQFNTSYASSRLTPQGTRRPTFIANLGLRQEFLQKKLALVLTVSDVFNSLKESSVLDTPALKEELMRRRSARIVYLGFSYNFGRAPKKAKDVPLKFDEQL